MSFKALMFFADVKHKVVNTKRHSITAPKVMSLMLVHAIILRSNVF